MTVPEREFRALLLSPAQEWCKQNNSVTRELQITTCLMGTPRSPFLGMLAQLTLCESQVPAVQARSLCEWLRHSKWHAEHGSSEAAEQPLSSSGLLRDDCNKNSNLITATKHVLSLFPLYIPISRFSGWLQKSISK